MFTDTAADPETLQEMPVEICAGDDATHMSIWRLPKLLWAGVALIAINSLVGVGMFFAPNVELDMYGHEVRAVSASLKPSPFAQTVDTNKKKIQTAAKLMPVIDTAPVLEQVSMMDAASTTLSLDIPRTSRVSYQPDVPARTQNAVYDAPRSTPRPLESLSKPVIN